MTPNFRLVHKEDHELMLLYLRRSIGYCSKAKSTLALPDDADATESYPGASGYAMQTMTMVADMLERSLDG